MFRAKWIYESICVKGERSVCLDVDGEVGWDGAELMLIVDLNNSGGFSLWYQPLFFFFLVVASTQNQKFSLILLSVCWCSYKAASTLMSWCVCVFMTLDVWVGGCVSSVLWERILCFIDCTERWNQLSASLVVLRLCNWKQTNKNYTLV